MSSSFSCLDARKGSQKKIKASGRPANKAGYVHPFPQGNRIKMLFLGDMEKFEEITSALDPRVKGRCKHKVSDIIIIAIATYLCGGDDYVSMYELCRERGEDLRPLVELPNGCPSVDTFERVISRIDPKAFGACLSVFGDTLIEDLNLKGNTSLLMANEYADQNPLIRSPTYFRRGSMNSPFALPERRWMRRAMKLRPFQNCLTA